MSEKLRSKYQDALKERDALLYETKRIRGDYDSYVKDTDQDMFCLRNELNTVRARLLDSENEALNAKNQCISLNEEINKLHADVYAFIC